MTSDGFAFGKARVTLKDVADCLNRLDCRYISNSDQICDRPVTFWLWTWTESRLCDGLYIYKNRPEFRVIRFDYGIECNYWNPKGTITRLWTPECATPCTLTFLGIGDIVWRTELISKIYVV
jgi:hypothetical protein